MVRKLPGITGITDVSFRVKDLFLNQSYPTHVHNAPVQWVAVVTTKMK